LVSGIGSITSGTTATAIVSVTTTGTWSMTTGKISETSGLS